MDKLHFRLFKPFTDVALSDGADVWRMRDRKQRWVSPPQWQQAVSHSQWQHLTRQHRTHQTDNKFLGGI